MVVSLLLALACLIRVAGLFVRVVRVFVGGHALCSRCLCLSSCVCSCSFLFGLFCCVSVRVCFFYVCVLCVRG